MQIPALPRGRFAVGESPVWNGHRLFWASITDGQVHAFDPGTGAQEAWRLGSVVGSFGFCADGRMVAALKDSVVLFDLATGGVSTLATIPHERPDMRLNDGVVGPDGAFWVGSMDTRPEKEPLGALYRVDHAGTVTTICGGLKVSNGLAWSPDGRTMFHADTRGVWIDRWDFDAAQGRAGHRRRFVTPDAAMGRPDGAACDMDGFYWSAAPSASRVNRFSPDGELVSFVAVPNYRPTMPCFGGTDGRTVYVTSLSTDVSDAERRANPDCGTIASFRAPVSGAPSHRFGRPIDTPHPVA